VLPLLRRGFVGPKSCTQPCHRVQVRGDAKSDLRGERSHVRTLANLATPCKPR
jgi:hypothetical protein